MTAILEDIRRLDAAYARGELTTVELADAKARLMDAIPDVTPDVAADEPARATEPQRRQTVAPMLLFCALILAACAGMALLLTGDLLLSATLAVTVLAALSVMLFRELDG